MALRIRTSLVTLALTTSTFLACSSSSPEGVEPRPDAGGSDDAAVDGRDASPIDPPGAQDGIQTPEEKAGSRLRPVYARYEGNDGSSHLVPRDWYDAERDEYCRMQRLSDGEMHCAPTGDTIALSPSEFFQDASCSAPVIGFYLPVSDGGRDCANVYAWRQGKRTVRIAGGDYCAPPKIGEFPKGARLAATQVFRKASNGTCQAFPLGGTNIEVYASTPIIAEIAPDAFVKMTVSDVTPTTPHRLRSSYARLVGSDGSEARDNQWIVDSERNEYCHAQTASDGKLRCIPDAPYFSASYYATSSCTTPVYMVGENKRCDADGRYAFSRYMMNADVCGKTTIFPRFRDGETSRIYMGVPGQCTPYAVESGQPGGYSYYNSSLPAALPPSAFVEVIESTKPLAANVYGKSGSRLELRNRIWGTASGDEHEWYRSPWDKGLEAFCYPVTLPNGKAYCVPETVEWLSYYSKSTDLFADSGCTEALVGNFKPAQCGSSRKGTRYFRERPYSANGCETSRILTPTAAPVTMTRIYRRSGGTCQAVDATNYELFRATDMKDVDPNTFVEMTSTLEK